MCFQWVSQLVSIVTFEILSQCRRLYLPSITLYLHCNLSKETSSCIALLFTLGLFKCVEFYGVNYIYLLR